MAENVYIFSTVQHRQALICTVGEIMIHDLIFTLTDHEGTAARHNGVIGACPPINFSAEREAVGSKVAVTNDTVFAAGAHLNTGIQECTVQVLDIVIIAAVGCKVNAVPGGRQRYVNQIDILTLTLNGKRIGLQIGNVLLIIDDGHTDHTCTLVQGKECLSVRIVATEIRQNSRGSKAVRPDCDTAQLNACPDVDMIADDKRTGRQPDGSTRFLQVVDCLLKDAGDIGAVLGVIGCLGQADQLIGLGLGYDRLAVINVGRQLGCGIIGNDGIRKIVAALHRGIDQRVVGTRGDRHGGTRLGGHLTVIQNNLGRAVIEHGICARAFKHGTDKDHIAAASGRKIYGGGTVVADGTEVAVAGDHPGQLLRIEAVIAIQQIDIIHMSVGRALGNLSAQHTLVIAVNIDVGYIRPVDTLQDNTRGIAQHPGAQQRLVGRAGQAAVQPVVGGEVEVFQLTDIVTGGVLVADMQAGAVNIARILQRVARLREQRTVVDAEISVDKGNVTNRNALGAALRDGRRIGDHAAVDKRLLGIPERHVLYRALLIEHDRGFLRIGLALTVVDAKHRTVGSSLLQVTDQSNVCGKRERFGQAIVAYGNKDGTAAIGAHVRDRILKGAGIVGYTITLGTECQYVGVGNDLEGGIVLSLDYAGHRLVLGAVFLGMHGVQANDLGACAGDVEVVAVKGTGKGGGEQIDRHLGPFALYRRLRNLCGFLLTGNGHIIDFEGDIGGNVDRKGQTNVLTLQRCLGAVVQRKTELIGIVLAHMHEQPAGLLCNGQLFQRLRGDLLQLDTVFLGYLGHNNVRISLKVGQSGRSVVEHLVILLGLIVGIDAQQRLDVNAVRADLGMSGLILKGHIAVGSRIGGCVIRGLIVGHFTTRGQNPDHTDRSANHQSRDKHDKYDAVVFLEQQQYQQRDCQSAGSTKHDKRNHGRTRRSFIRRLTVPRLLDRGLTVCRLPLGGGNDGKCRRRILRTDHKIFRNIGGKRIGIDVGHADVIDLDGKCFFIVIGIGIKTHKVDTGIVAGTFCRQGDLNMIPAVNDIKAGQCPCDLFLITGAARGQLQRFAARHRVIGVGVGNVQIKLQAIGACSIDRRVPGTKDGKGSARLYCPRNTRGSFCLFVIILTVTTTEPVRGITGVKNDILIQFRKGGGAKQSDQHTQRKHRCQQQSDLPIFRSKYCFHSENPFSFRVSGTRDGIIVP